MTSREKDTCTNLMNEAIKNARYSIDSYKRAEDQTSEVEKQIAKLKGQNHLGYAQGINQVLASLKFEHEKMKELSELI